MKKIFGGIIATILLELVKISVNTACSSLIYQKVAV